MFHGTKDEQKALTQELRDLTLLARGLGSRLEMLLPHLTGADDFARVQEAGRDADRAAAELARLYPLAIKRLEDTDESR